MAHKLDAKLRSSINKKKLRSSTYAFIHVSIAMERTKREEGCGGAGAGEGRTGEVANCDLDGGGERDLGRGRAGIVGRDLGRGRAGVVGQDLDRGLAGRASAGGRRHRAGGVEQGLGRGRACDGTLAGGGRPALGGSCCRRQLAGEPIRQIQSTTKSLQECSNRQRTISGVPHFCVATSTNRLRFGSPVVGLFLMFLAQFGYGSPNRSFVGDSFYRVNPNMQHLYAAEEIQRKDVNYFLLPSLWQSASEYMTFNSKVSRKININMNCLIKYMCNLKYLTLYILK
jgi:hypothetical protein